MEESNLFLLEEISEYLHNAHDKGYKLLLSSKKVFIELLRSFVKQSWVESIDEGDIISVDKSYILQDFSEKEADLVYKVNMKGSEVIFYILLELQSTVDFHMPYRLLLYMTEIWRGIIKDTSREDVGRKSFKLPAIVPLVLYNGENSWTAAKSFREILAGHEQFDVNILDFRYILLDVNRYSKEELLGLSNLIGSVFLLDQKVGINELQSRLNQLVDTLKELDKNNIGLFNSWLKNVLTRRMNISQREKMIEVIDESKEAGEMVYNLEKTIEEIHMSAMIEGLKEGEARGEIKGRMQIVEKMLTKGFGIEEIADMTGITLEDIQRKKEEMGLN